MLLILERYEIEAPDLRRKIIWEVFPPPSWEAVIWFLKERILPARHSPDFWDWDMNYKHGGTAEEESGLDWDDREWLRKACHLL